MTEQEAQRIVTARALMWESAGIGEKAQWLAEADRALSSLEAAAQRPAVAPSATEGGGPARLSVVKP